eukprot:jgi/Galph1/3271/GphlegSOOS_G1887.1
MGSIAESLEKSGLASFFDQQFVNLADIRNTERLREQCKKELETLKKEEVEIERDLLASLPFLQHQQAHFREEFNRLLQQTREFRAAFERLLSISKEAADISVQWQIAKSEESALKIVIDCFRLREKIFEAMEEEDGEAALKYIHDLLFVTFPDKETTDNMLEELRKGRSWLYPYLQDTLHSKEQAVLQVRDMLQRRLLEVLEQMKFDANVLCFYDQPQRWKKTQKLIVLLDQLQSYANKCSLVISVGESLLQSNIRWYLFPLAESVIHRFEYHFLSDRETSRLDKPEWTISFLMERLKEMQPVLDEGVQEAIDKVREDREEEDAFVSFARIVIHLFGKKLAKGVVTLENSTMNITSSAEVQNIFFHLIDQGMAFDSAVRDMIDNRLVLDPFPSCLVEAHQLNPTFLATWTGAELFRSQDSVQQALKKLIDGDSGAVEEIINTVIAICYRAKALPCLSVRAQFVRLTQVPLLETLRMEFLGYLEEDIDDVMGHFRRCLIILNAANYVQNSLEDWKDDLFYLELAPFLPTSMKNPSSPQNPVSFSNSIIESELEHFAKLKQNFVSHLEKAMEAQFRQNAKDYVAIFESSWRESQKNWVLRMAVIEDLSPEIAPAVYHLRNHLSLISSIIYDSMVAADIWRPLSHSLDRFLFHDLVLNCGEKNQHASKDIAYASNPIDGLALQLLSRIVRDFSILREVFLVFTTKPYHFFPLMRDTEQLVNWLMGEEGSLTEQVQQRYDTLFEHVSLLESDSQIETTRIVLKEQFGIRHVHPYLLRQVLYCLRRKE